jgi:sugar lactone lactonase YvrE
MKFPNIPHSIRLTFALLVASHFAHAAPQIEYRGVLGNSGVTGETLVHYSDRGLEDKVKSSGLVLDKEGFLWGFAGLSTLNRYAIDGRLISSHPLSPHFKSGTRALTLAGDTLVLLAADRLWSLDIHAPVDSLPTSLNIAAKALSLNSYSGKVTFIDNKSTVKLLDVASGKTKSLATLPAGARQAGVSMMPNGTIYIQHSLRLLPNGQFESVQLPGNAPNLQWAGDHLYCFSWHTTVQQLDVDGNASPGVVYGGSSGAFIGSLPKDGEIQFPSGIAHLGDNRYAITGETGVIHILKWNADTQAFDAVRRLGAIHRKAGLAIDPQGRIWWNTGYWDWTDHPSAILKNTTWSTVRQQDAWQVDTLASGALTGLATDRSNPALIRNVVDFPTTKARGDGRYDRTGIASIKGLPAKPTGAAALGAAGKEALMVVDAQGLGVRIRVDKNGNARGLVGPVTLHLKSAKPAITSLAHTDSGELFAADGGAIVRFAPVADGFTETARYTAADTPSSAFGSNLYIDGDCEYIWVSDTENNRVMVLEPQSDELQFIASFNGTPESGLLNAPERIAVTNGRAVLLDWMNQRLLRLELIP